MHMQHIRKTCTDNAGLSTFLLNPLQWTAGPLALSFLCLLTSLAKVNSVSGASSQEALWADGYQRTLIGFANSWAGCCLPPVDTCTHMQESNFRLLYPKISAEGDPNCIGKRSGTGWPAGHIFNTFASDFTWLNGPYRWELFIIGLDAGFWNRQATILDPRSTPLCRHVSPAIACVGVTILTFITDDDGCFYNNTVTKALQSWGVKFRSVREASVNTSSSICDRHRDSVQSFISHIMSVPDLLKRKKAGFLLHHISKWSLFIWWKVCVGVDQY